MRASFVGIRSGVGSSSGGGNIEDHHATVEAATPLAPTSLLLLPCWGRGTAR